VDRAGPELFRDAPSRAHAHNRNGTAVTSPPLTTVRSRALFAPLEGGARADTVARRLTTAIGLGLLLDGERLPTESDLAGQLGVSTGTLRDGLATLRTMGLVETRRGRAGGTFVRTPREQEPARLELPLRQLSLHELRDIGDHRAAISGAAARLAAERALDSEVATLREHLTRLRAASGLTDRRRADARIHIEIAATAQSPRLTGEELELWSTVGDLVWLGVAEESAGGLIEEHATLIDAIERHEPERARAIAERHVAAETGRLVALRLALGGL
jgi:GntR family transcriptional repressor for pyruvate dehydrogenase complex